MLGDAAYGRQVLAHAEDSGDETLVMLALSIKDQLGYLKVAPTAPPPSAPVETKPTAARNEKYMFGPRSSRPATHPRLENARGVAPSHSPDTSRC